MQMEYIRGNIQSPLGSLALISTRPYLKLKDFFERSFALTTGGKMRLRPACRSHSTFGSTNVVQSLESITKRPDRRSFSEKPDSAT